MQTTKEFYRNYLADDNFSDLSKKLVQVLQAEEPNHVLEFGCGTGKHLGYFNDGVGLDISFINITHAHVKKEASALILGDETHLRHLCNFDVVFTCSVLDHIEDISGIIGEFKRIANKSVILAETNSFEGNHYYKHDYENHGFMKVGLEKIETTCKDDSEPTYIYRGTPYTWQSNPQTGDGGIYHIWKWSKS